MSALTTTHRSLVALTPGDVPAAQAEIVSWCKSKIVELSHELRDARQNMRQAKAMLWRYSGWQSVIRKTTARMLYYVKIKAAVEAGYLIVPNFPAEIFAVRVEKDTPSLKYGTYPTDVNETKAQHLPPGVGRYVDEMIRTQDLSHHQSDGKGGTTLVRSVRTDGYNDEVDFPVALVKPIILAATHRAMDLRIFDRIGVAHHGGQTASRARRKSDPIVVGQIIDPTMKVGYREPKLVTFFIAWWLDTRTL